MAADKKLVRSPSGMRMIPQDVTMTSPFVIDEPPWIPDNQCQHCTACRAKFDFFQRRHHCRRCGQCFCGKCCHVKCNLPRMYFIDPVLHCNSCHSITCRENEFFYTQMKTLQMGSQFLVSGSAIPGDAVLLSCRLSLDERLLLFDAASPGNSFVSYEPIELLRIKSIQAVGSKRMSPTTSEPPASPSAVGLILTYKDTEEQGQTMELLISDVSTASIKKQAMTWLSALLKAKKVLPHLQ